MNRTSLKRWSLVLSLGLAACGTERVIYHQVTPPDTSITVTVTPRYVSLFCQDSVRLAATVTGKAGVSQSVTWVSFNPDAVEIDSTGLVHAWIAGLTTILASSVADPTKAGLATVTVPAQLPPSVTISPVVEAATGQAPDFNVFTDSIDVTFNVDWATCGRGVLPWTVTAILTNGQDSLTAAMPVPMGPTGMVRVKVRLNTAAKRADGTPVLHNGTYTLSGRLVGSNGFKLNSSNTVTLTVAN